jgi:type II secretory pathway pseudopilin PulG
MKRMEPLLIVTIILAISAVLLLYFFLEARDENKRLTRQLDSYTSTYDSKQGWTRMYGDSDKGLSYNIHTFDGGKTWYACEWSDNWELKILGEVEKVYPGLMSHLEAWDNLTNHVAKNGPIDPTKMTPELGDILKNAKIEIKIGNDTK